MCPALLTPDALARDLSCRDLTDPAAGPHALQVLVDDIAAALKTRWRCDVETVRANPIVSVEDNYDRLRFSPDDVTRDARYSRYVSETCLLRTHTSALVVPALRRLRGPRDLLLVCPGMVYRRDAIDRLHTGTPHQLDLWRVTQTLMTDGDLEEMIAVVIVAALPGREWRTEPKVHPYTEAGRQIDVLSDDGGEWIEVGECGLASPDVISSVAPAGLAMGLGLDRLLMLRKGIPDIRLLRSSDPRVARQMLDLSPYRLVSSKPAVSRDLSVAVEADATDESLGDLVREALGQSADSVELVQVLSETPAADVPPVAAERLGIRPGQKNVLLRVVLRNLDRTLTNIEANMLRDRIYAVVHQGG
jgi:phenylalanyl-tRNA synthetase alpha chain